MPARGERRRPFWYLWRRPGVVASEIDDELNTHLELRLEELRAQGLSSEEAREEALRRFGDLEYTRRYCREQDLAKEDRMRRRLTLEDLGQDMRIGLRALRRVPAMTSAIVATVGLGIGATTTIATAIDASLLRPLPYHHAERLVQIYTDSPPNRFRLSLADYFAIADQQTQFERVAAYTDRAMSFSDGAVAERVAARQVSWTYFGLLAVAPVLGRDFTASDDLPGSAPTAVVSHAFWQRRLGGQPDAVGRALRLDGADHLLVGVLPRSVGPLERGRDVFVAGRWESPRRRGPFFYTVLGRLPPRAGSATAAEELRAINRRIFPLWQVSYQDERATWSLMPLKAYVVGDVRTLAGLALASVVLVWLIACANASNLLVARVTSRRRELSIRAALGASRARVARHLLVESALLAVGSAALGTTLAWAGIRLLRSYAVGYFPRTGEVEIGAASLWAVAALSAASALLFGLVPALHGTGGRVDESLRLESRSSTGSRGARRLRQALVGSQFAIATPLLIGAGLLFASLNQLGRVDLGFDSRNLLSTALTLPPAQYPEEGRVTGFWDELRRRVAALPGVAEVAFTDSRPPDDADNFNNFDLEDAPTPPGQSQPVTPWVAVTPEYFRLLGITVHEGRLFDERDATRPEADGEVVIVDQAWAKRFFPAESAVGKRLRGGGCTTCPWTTVVGVVGNVKYAGLHRPDEGSVYTVLPPASRSRYLAVRTTLEPRSMLPSVQRVVAGLDPGLPLSSVATIDDLVDRSLQTPRSLSMLVGGFAAVALVLAVVGIYGVMAYFVQQHRKEIGIRLALGGRPADVLRLIVRQAMTVVWGGVFVGLLAALALTRWMSSLLFGVSAADAVTFASVAGLMLATALLACTGPARRAMALQPAVVLRGE